MKTIKESTEYNLQIANEILDTNYTNWQALSRHEFLTEDFIRDFEDEVDWYCISRYQRLSEDFIREFQDRLEMFWIAQYQILSEDFIRDFKNKLDWSLISKCQHLSEDFIREFKDYVNWEYISQYQHLSEDFIGEFTDRVYWDYISQYQRLSEDFIRRFKNRVGWHLISKYQRLSDGFIREFKDRVEKIYVAYSWLYKSTEDKKKAVMDTGLYECHNDYFIAYKGIRRDRYSNFNFQYQYLKGETYETWCDCSDDKFSFGFSAWTEKEARNYCDELVVRVKIRYEDVGRVVHDGGKIRCFKMEILD